LRYVRRRVNAPTPKKILKLVHVRKDGACKSKYSRNQCRGDNRIHFSVHPLVKGLLEQQSNDSE